MVRKAGGNHGLVVGARARHAFHHLARAQRRQDARQRLAAQAAIAFGQAGVGDLARPCLVHASVLHQPIHQPFFAFFIQQLQDDLVLKRGLQLEPARTEMLIPRHRGAGGIAFQFGALFILQVELHHAP